MKKYKEVHEEVPFVCLKGLPPNVNRATPLGNDRQV
jgi:hypothetical protein